MKVLAAILIAAAALGTHTPVRRLGGDTDAVIARGLFPLGRQNPPLTLLSDTARVSLGPNGMTTTRVYWIRNDGDSGAISLATVCGINELDVDCGQVQIGGASPASTRQIGYLIDSGASVAIKPKSRREIEDCLKELDGNVCGQEWTTFAVNLRAGDSLRASLRYRSPFSERNWIESAVEPLHLYTEKFWFGESVPNVAVWAELEGGKLIFQHWIPRGLHRQYSHRPTGEREGALYWQLDGYRPVKKQYTYLFRLVHPYSVDSARIRATYLKAVAR